ncbi:hypothetical protein [Tunturiibacter gelidiferens]|uniref:hypothetical protein n=1 Tax=Tunturiibacter gelidiferens TaxID=3069689 RepID=UPI003D9B7FFF
MKRKTLRAIASRSFALVVVVAAAWQAQAQDAKTPYPSMAPLDQYLMERSAEITLARSAAPESISQDSEIMAAWLRNRGQRQERLRVHGGAILVGRNRRSRVLESLVAGSDLPQPGGRAILPSTHYQEDRVGFGWTIQSPDARGSQPPLSTRILSSNLI